MPISDAVDALATLLGDRFTTSKSDLDIHGRSETHFAQTPPMVWPIPTPQKMLR